jgi:hypothetical protein
MAGADVDTYDMLASFEMNAMGLVRYISKRRERDEGDTAASAEPGTGTSGPDA